VVDHLATRIPQLVSPPTRAGDSDLISHSRLILFSQPPSSLLEKLHFSLVNDTISRVSVLAKKEKNTVLGVIVEDKGGPRVRSPRRRQLSPGSDTSTHHHGWISWTPFNRQGYRVIVWKAVIVHRRPSVLMPAACAVTQKVPHPPWLVSNPSRATCQSQSRRRDLQAARASDPSVRIGAPDPLCRGSRRPQKKDEGRS
jgi:hypothetical protein